MRLNKFLARCGIGSRRKCDEFIKEKKIKINGQVVTNYSYIVKDNDYVQYNKKILSKVEEDYIYILNKPRGYVSTSTDPKGRKTILELLPQKIRLFNIGRLDYNTTGLILITNNGDLANDLLHPKNKFVKKYYVESSNKLSSFDLENIKNGFKIIDFGKVSANIKLEKRVSRTSYIWNVELQSGKNRVIRRIFSHFNNPINKLHRYEFAGISLGNIKSGKYKRIKLSELKKIVFKK